MKVSIVIPCFNLGMYLRDAIESVLNQTFTDWELIVVDDGSTDEQTKEILSRLSYPKTILYQTKNKGLPKARNLGVSHAKGQYIACLDADDKYHPEFLEKTVKLLDDDKSGLTGMVTTWIQTFGNRDEIWKTSVYDPILLSTKNLLHVASLFRRVCWEKVGGYTESLTGYQDWDFWIKIVAAGYRWECIEEALFHYQVRDKSMIFFSNQKREQLFQAIVHNNKNFYKKHLEEVITHFFSIAEKYEAAGVKIFEQEKELLRKSQDVEKLRVIAEQFLQVLNQRAHE